jgi:Glucose-6-phosphate dehydrogenase, NAD binding domain
VSDNGMSAGPRPDDRVLVLFGGTGDMARRKLLPGLFHLHVAGLLPREYRIVGSAPPQSPGGTGWPSSGIPQAAGRGGQAVHGGLKAPIWAMIDAMSSAAHSSLILPSVTR